MRFAITADHREFFSKNQFIEFEGMISLDQVADLKENAEKTIAPACAFLQKNSNKPLPLKSIKQAMTSGAIMRRSKKSPISIPLQHWPLN